DDPAREATEARRVTAWVEIDATDQRGVDHRRPRADVEEERDADPVEEIAGVPGRRAADVEEGQPGHDRRHAGEALDGAERVAERARDLAHLGAREGRGATGFAPIAADGDVLDLAPLRRRSGRHDHRRRRDVDDGRRRRRWWWRRLTQDD